jgi:hypothetical protein
VDLVVLAAAASGEAAAVENFNLQINFNHIVYNVEQQKVLQNGELSW